MEINVENDNSWLPPQLATGAVIPGYLSKSATAKFLNKSEHTLDRWHRQRVGPVRTKIGSTVLYRVEALRAWFLAQEKAQLQRAQ